MENQNMHAEARPSPKGWLSRLLSPEGRIGRQTFAIRGLCVFPLLYVATSFAIDVIATDDLGVSPGAMLLALLTMTLALAVMGVAIVQRLHDLDLDGRWLAVIAAMRLLPVIGEFVGSCAILFLLLAPGDSGHNQYGEP